MWHSGACVFFLSPLPCPVHICTSHIAERTKSPTWDGMSFITGALSAISAHWNSSQQWDVCLEGQISTERGTYVRAWWNMCWKAFWRCPLPTPSYDSAKLVPLQPQNHIYVDYYTYIWFTSYTLKLNWTDWWCFWIKGAVSCLTTRRRAQNWAKASMWFKKCSHILL